MRPFISPRVVITLLEHEAVDYAGSGSGRWGGVSDNPTCTGVSTVQNHSDVSAVACGSGGGGCPPNPPVPRGPPTKKTKRYVRPVACGSGCNAGRNAQHLHHCG